MLSTPIKMLLVAIMLTSGFALSACNTAEGFGKDLSTLGNKITGKAEKHNEK